MTLTSPWSSLLEVVVDSALRAAILAAAAGLGLAMFRVNSTSMRLSAWKGVLTAALAMPLLAWVLPSLPVPMPSAFQPKTTSSAALVVPRSSAAARVIVLNTLPGSRNSSSTNETSPGATGSLAANVSSRSHISATDILSWLSDNWLALVGGFYLVVAILFLGRLSAGLVLGRRLIAGSQRILDPRLLETLRSHRATDSLPVYESGLVSVPVTVGTIQPAIVLPDNWLEWSDAKIEAVIAHEVSHVIRRDALTQLLSRVYRAVFWFSPLAWWLNRELSILAEQASDEAALSGGADRAEYAKTLLGFFESLQTAPGRVWWQGVSMAKAGQAEHRLEKILSWKEAAHMGVKRSVLVVVMALAIPAVYLVAAARPANHNLVLTQSSQNLPAPAPAAIAGTPVPSAAAPSAAPVAPGAPIHGVIARGVTAPPLPATPGSPAIPPAPAALGEGQSHSYGVGHGYSYGYGYDDEQRFVIVSGNSDSMTMSGTGEDARHVEKLKKQISGDFIWFQRDEKSYIIRDKATVDRARSFWAPQEELGKKQEELGKQQEELGRQQEDLGSKMEQVKVHVPDMSAQLDALKAKLQKLGPEATMEQIGDLQSEIGELQSKLGELQGEAGDQQGKFGKLQGELGEKQGKLGEQQGKLGEQQAQLAEKATKQMKGLLDEAIKNGKAQPEPDNGGGASI